MTVGDALKTSELDRIDAEVLLCAILNCDRTFIAAHPEHVFTALQITTWQEYINRRANHEPVAHIVGTKEFFGRAFTVTKDTLVPRPATELLVETALHMIDGKEIPSVQKADEEIVIWSRWKNTVSPVQLIIDVGTGSGCIGITLACERPSINVIATDISSAALTIAQTNARTHQVSARIQFMEVSGLDSTIHITEPFLLVSNPPYIPESAILDPDVVDYEPASALFSGKEGTDVLHPLIQQALEHPLCAGFCVECREEQVTL